jgi:hypothetical protein
MATTVGPNYASDIKSASYAPLQFTDNAWVNPTFAASDDGGTAAVFAATFDAADSSYGLHCRGFGFSIPAGGTILGIQVEVDRICTTSTATDSGVWMMKTGTVGGVTHCGTGGGSVGLAWTVGSFVVAKYGGVASMWGTTWTPAEINGTAFGVLFAGSATGANADIGVDYVRVSVTYDYQAPPSTGGMVTRSRAPSWGRF